MTSMAKATVTCTAGHAVDLDSGRSLEPGQVAENVDTSHPHNRQLLDLGLLAEVQSGERKSASAKSKEKD